MKELSGKQYILVFIASCGLAACALGCIVNVNGVFFGPVSEALSVGRGAVSLAATLTAITTGFMGPLTIKTMQRIPFRRILTISVMITALATLGMALVSNLVIFDILSVIRGASSAFFGIPVITVLMGNWFVKKRGMLTGLVMSCSGIVGAILSPVLSKVINAYGYRTGYVICAGLMLLFTLPGMFVLREDPALLGGKAYGEGSDQTESQKKSVGNESFITYKKASFIFIGLCIAAFLCQSVCSICQHLAGIAEAAGQSSMVGALMISAAMVGNIFAKFAVGLLSDLLGAMNSAFILITAFLMGLFSLTFFADYEIILLVGSFLLGSSYACALMLSNVTFALYGTKQYGEVYSLLTVILNIGGALAITLVGMGYDIFHGYGVILFSGIAMTITAILLLAAIVVNMKKNRN